MSQTSSIARSACFNHPMREAAARCVSCGRSFCRECVTPLDRRMLCASCYKERTAPKEKQKRDWVLPGICAQIFVGLAILWLSWYIVGRAALSIPDDFHLGNLWGSFGQQ